MTQPEELSPKQALESARAARGAVADKVAKGSWIYDLIYSGLVAGLIASQGLPTPISLVGMAVCTTFLVVLAKGWAARNGVWISGVTPPRARWVAIGLGLVMATLMFVALYGSRTYETPWMALALTPVAFVVALGGSRLWLAVYRREIGMLP